MYVVHNAIMISDFHETLIKVIFYTVLKPSVCMSFEYSYYGMIILDVFFVSV